MRNESTQMGLRSEHSKRDTLLDAARQLFLERGYDDVSMQQITDAAGVSKAAPYYHFKNKDDLFIHVYIREMARIHDGMDAQLACGGSFRERIHHALEALVAESRGESARLFAEFERFTTLTNEPELKHAIADQVDSVKRLLPYFEAAHARGEIGRFPPERCCSLFLLMVMGHFQLMSVAKLGALPERATADLATELTGFFFDGIA
jgi:AcrR family transcriptional regulator